MTPLKVKRLNELAILPVRASDGAAAYDLSAAIGSDIVIAPGEITAVPTGIAIELPRGLVALVFSRSGQGMKYGVSLPNSVGVIDSDYRGELRVGLINHGKEPYTIHPADRIAQLMVTSAFELDIRECDELSPTERGAGGFGSTGAGKVESR